MFYNGPERDVAMAAMMGVMKEAKVTCKDLQDNKYHISKSMSIRKSVLGVIFDICHDCCAMEDSTGGSTAGECTFNQTDIKNLLELNLVKKSNLEERNNISQNTKDESNHSSCSMMDIAEQGSLVDTNETKKNVKIGSETEEVKEDNTMGKCTVGESILDGSADRNFETEEVKEDNTMGRSTVGEFILDGSADRNSSEKDNGEERDNIHENAENCYTNDLVKEDNLVDPDKINQNTKLPALLQLDNDESNSANKNDRETNMSEANKSERSSSSLQRKKSDLKIHKAANIRTIVESGKETPLLEIPEEITTLEDVLEPVSTINWNTDDDEGLLMKPHIAEKSDAEPHGAENLLEMIQQLQEAFDNQAVKVESVVGRVNKIQEEANAVAGELDAIKDGMKSHKILLEKII